MELTLSEWLKKKRTCPCPNCGYKIPNSLVKTSCYCPSCDKYWKLIRNEWNWKLNWYYFDPLKNKKEKSNNGTSK